MSVKINKNFLEVYNPATGKNFASVPMTSMSDLNTILDVAELAAKKFNYSSLSYRRKLVNRFMKSIANHKDGFVEIICNETGKKKVEAITEVFIALEHLKQLSNHLYEALGKQSRRVGILLTRKVWVEYEPMGVAAIISPWNYPLILTMSPFIEAILAGNTVVLKSSEQTPLTTKLLKEVWDKSTLNPDLFQPVYGGGDLGSSLVKSKQTDLICFIGSTKVGKIIAQECTKQFKPAILELGGKDPMIVLDDIDIDRTIEAAIWGGFSNSGQTCISVERIIVNELIYPIFIKKISQKIEEMSSGFADSLIGAITVDNGIKKLNNYINKIKNYSTIIQGKANKGCFFPPTLVVNPNSKHKMINEEVFGPVISIYPFKSLDHAIELANSTGYGLSASVFGSNKKDLRYITRRLKSGSIIINDVLTHYGITDLPFGGIGLSGRGKVHSREGLRSFSNQKSYMSTRFKLKSELWWYKRNKKFGKLLDRLISWRYA